MAKLQKFHDIRYGNTATLRIKENEVYGKPYATKAGMRRAEEEYYATVWALERCKEYGLKVPEKTIAVYQQYIDYTKDRGKRRGGSGYATLSLTERW